MVLGVSRGEKGLEGLETVPTTFTISKSKIVGHVELSRCVQDYGPP